jgi:pimeloyl-ACP methyl ester carboxylesterase
MADVGRKMGVGLDNLILLAGLLCDERLWAAQAKGLAASARVVTPDLTGCESIESMADGVLGQVPGGFSLAGFSMGGCVALEVASQGHPNGYAASRS